MTSQTPEATEIEKQLKELQEYLSDWAIIEPEKSLILGNVRRILLSQEQKYRETWLREEIVKLEGMSVDPNYSDHWKHGYYQALQTIIDRHHSELD